LRAKWGPVKPTISAAGLFAAATPNLFHFHGGWTGHLNMKLPAAKMVPDFFLTRLKNKIPVIGK